MSRAAIGEFIRRFLIHVLPAGFHRIRYYGLLAGTTRARNIARARQLLALPLLAIDAIKAASTEATEPQTPQHPCPCCGGRMIIIETLPARLLAALPPNPARGRNQDRYPMIPSQPVNNPGDALLSCWLSDGSVQAHVRPSHRTTILPPMLAQPALGSFTRLPSRCKRRGRPIVATASNHPSA
jgi:hypothetical protein